MKTLWWSYHVTQKINLPVVVTSAHQQALGFQGNAQICEDFNGQTVFSTPFIQLQCSCKTSVEMEVATICCLVWEIIRMPIEHFVSLSLQSAPCSAILQVICAITSCPLNTFTSSHEASCTTTDTIRRYQSKDVQSRTERLSSWKDILYYTSRDWPYLRKLRCKIMEVLLQVWSWAALEWWAAYSSRPGLPGFQISHTSKACLKACSAAENCSKAKRDVPILK